MNLNPDDDFTNSIAIHEAGHSTVATHFGVGALPEILNEGRSLATGATYPEYAGLCSYDDQGPIPPLRYCAMCWAGELAQSLFGTPPEWAPPFKPTWSLLRDWHSAMLVQLGRFSQGDRAGIMASYRTSWRACKIAYRIVRKNERHIIRLAKAITAGRTATPPVRMPEKFPAALADFMQLVIGGTDPESRFRAFITDQGQRLLSQPQFGLDPDELRQAVATWTTGRMERMSAGFPSADEWVKEATAFREWAKAKHSTAQTP